MGFRIDPTIAPRLLFFYRQNQYCDNYHARYLDKFKKWIFYFNMDAPTEKDTEAAKSYQIKSVPTLILLNKDGYEDLRWIGGMGPDSHLISIEIGMERAWWKDDGQNDDEQNKDP